MSDPFGAAYDSLSKRRAADPFADAYDSLTATAGEAPHADAPPESSGPLPGPVAPRAPGPATPGVPHLAVGADGRLTGSVHGESASAPRVPTLRETLDRLSRPNYAAMAAGISRAPADIPWRQPQEPQFTEHPAAGPLPYRYRDPLAPPPNPAAPTRGQQRWADLVGNTWPVQLGQAFFGWLPSRVPRETRELALAEAARRDPLNAYTSRLLAGAAEIAAAGRAGVPFGEGLPLSETTGFPGVVERAVQRAARTGTGLAAFSAGGEAAKGGSPAEIARAAAAGGLQGAAWGAGLGLFGEDWAAGVRRLRSLFAGTDLARARGPADPLVTAMGGDPYATLGLDRANATPGMVQSAFQRLSRQWHPDVNPDPMAGDVQATLERARSAALADLGHRGVAEPGARPQAAPAAPAAPPTAAAPPEAAEAAAPTPPGPVPSPWAAEAERYAAAAEPTAPTEPAVPVAADFRSPPSAGDVAAVAAAEKPGLALHDVEGRPIPGTEIRPPLAAGPVPRAPQPEQVTEPVFDRRRGVQPYEGAERRAPAAAVGPSEAAAGTPPAPAAAPGAAPEGRRPGNADLSAQTPPALRQKYGKLGTADVVARWNQLQDRVEQAQREAQTGGAGTKGRRRAMAKLAGAAATRDQGLLADVEQVLRARGLDPDEMWLQRGHDQAAARAEYQQGTDAFLYGEQPPEWVTRSEEPAPIGTEAGDRVEEPGAPYGAAAGRGAVAEHQTPYAETVSQGNLFGPAEVSGPEQRELLPFEPPRTPPSATAEAKAAAGRKLKPEEVAPMRLGREAGEPEPPALSGEAPLPLPGVAEPPAPYGAAGAAADLARPEPYEPPTGVADTQQMEMAFGSPEAHERAAKLALEANRVPTYDERRAVIPTGRQTWVDVRGKRLASAEDVALLNRPFRSPQTETLEALHVAGGRVVAREAVTSGALDYVDFDLARFAARLADRARRTGAEAVAVGHNHPSGNPWPSAEDKWMTAALAARLGSPPYARTAGRPLTVEHVVTDDDIAMRLRVDPENLGALRSLMEEYDASPIAAQGELRGRILDLVTVEPVRVRPPDAPAPDWTATEGPWLGDAADAVRLAGPVADNEMHVLYRDTGGRAVALVPHRGSAAGTLATWLPQEARSLGAANAVIAVPSTSPDLWRQLTNGVPDEVLDVVGLDPRTGVYESAEASGKLFGVGPRRPAGRQARHVVGEAETPPYGASGTEPVPAGRGAASLPAGQTGSPADTDLGSRIEAILNARPQGELPLGSEPARPLTPQERALVSGPPADGKADALDLDSLPLADVAEAPTGKGARRLIEAAMRMVNPEWMGRMAKATADVRRARSAEMVRVLRGAQAAMAPLDRYVTGLPRREQLKVWDAMEHGRPTGHRVLDAPGGIAALRAISDRLAQTLVRFDILRAEQLRENYVGRQWQVDPAAVRRVEGALGAKRPARGPMSFAKRRTFDYFADGLRAIAEAKARLAGGQEQPGDGDLAAMKPLTYNAVRSQMGKIEEQLKAVQHHLIVQDELAAQRATWLPVGDEPPVDAEGQRWVRVDPEGRDPSFIKYGPRMLTKGGVEVVVPGRIELAHLYAPRQSATIWQNAMSRGIRGDPTFGPLYHAYMAMANASTQLELSFSGFHLATIAREAVSASSEIGLSKLLAGKGSESAAAVARAAAAPGLDLELGRRVLAQYMNPGVHPELEPVIRALVAGGARLGPETEWYDANRMGILRDAFYTAVERENPAGRRLWNGIKVAPDLLWAVVEGQMRPIMAYVGYLKAAAGFRAVADEMAKLPPDITREDFLRRMSLIRAEMESRYGQVAYDNYFMPQVVKDVAQIIFRAPGWTAGGAHLLVRGAAQLGAGAYRVARRVLGQKRPNEEVVGRTGRYVLASVVAYLLFNGAANYIFTGQYPRGKDWWAFRDGTLDQNGNPNRFTIPGYEGKDWYNWLTHPWRTLLNKRKRVLTALGALISNRDWKGDFLWDPDHPTIGAVGKALLVQTAEPITFSNLSRMRTEAAGRSAAERALPFFGVSPAARQLQQTPAQNLMASYLSRFERSPRTPAQQAAAAARADTLVHLRRGEPIDVGRKLALAAATDPLLARFRRLPLAQAERVYAAGRPWERALWADALATKREKAGLQ